MSRFRAVVVSLGMGIGAAACYSPGYRDCQVGCAEGACPSGLTCDQGLGVCRLEGATGSCPAPDDDSGVVSRDVIEGDSQTSMYCATRPGALFCQDFDTGTISTQGWDTVDTTAGGTVTLVPSTQSMPNALESMTPAATANGMGGNARVFDGLAVPPGFTQLSIEFEISFAERDGALAPKGAFRVDALPGFSVTLTSNGPTQTYTLVNEDPVQQVFDDGLVPGVWYRYQFVVIAPAGSAAMEVYATRDGAPVGPQGGRIGGSNRPPASVPWRVGVGAVNASANGQCRFLYDNVVITATM